MIAPAFLQGLDPLGLFALAPAPDGADNANAIAVRPMGSGADAAHNALRFCCGLVVGSVVGFSRFRSRAWFRPQRHNTKNRPSLVCACAQVRTIGICLLWRCGVVSLSISLKDKKERHNTAHNGATTARCGQAKALENLNKGGF